MCYEELLKYYALYDHDILQLIWGKKQTNCQSDLPPCTVRNASIVYFADLVTNE